VPDPYWLLRAAKRTPGRGHAEWTAEDGTRLILTAPRRSTFKDWWMLAWYEDDPCFPGQKMRRGVHIHHTASHRAFAKREFGERIAR